jgi:hypothetical protein
MVLQEDTPQLEVQPPAIMQTDLSEAVEFGTSVNQPALVLPVERRRSLLKLLFSKKRPHLVQQAVAINKNTANSHFGAKISKPLNLQAKHVRTDVRELISIDAGDDATSRLEQTSAENCYDSANVPIDINSIEWASCRAEDVFLFVQGWARNTDVSKSIGQEHISSGKKSIIGDWLVYVCGNNKKRMIELEQQETLLSKTLNSSDRSVLDAINLSLATQMAISATVSTNLGDINRAYESVTYEAVCEAIINDIRTTYMTTDDNDTSSQARIRNMVERLVKGTLITNDAYLFYTVTTDDLATGGPTRSSVRIYRWLEPRGGIYNQHAREIVTLTDVPIWATIPKTQRTNTRQLIQQVEIERSINDDGKPSMVWGANPNMSAPPAKRLVLRGQESLNSHDFIHLKPCKDRCWVDAVLSKQEQLQAFGFNKPKPEEWLACNLPTMLGLVSATIENTSDVHMLSSKKKILWTQTATGGVESARVCHVLVRPGADRTTASKQRIRICYAHGVGRNSLAEVWGANAVV